MPKPIFRWVSPSPFRFIQLPNLITYVSFLAAVWAAQFAIDENWQGAGAAIGVSALADMLDGKFARLFKRSAEEARFGAELDSLIDVVAFGMAPLVCLRLYYFPSEDSARFARNRASAGGGSPRLTITAQPPGGSSLSAMRMTACSSEDAGTSW